MNILLVAATAFEIHPVLSQLTPIQSDEKEAGHYGLGNLEIDLLITGIGMIHTAFHLGQTLALKRYDFVLNAGIAGAYNTTMKLGKVVHVTRDCVAEFGTDEGTRFVSFFESELMDPDVFPYKSGYLFNEKWPDLPILNDLPQSTGNTVNRIHSAPETIELLTNYYPAELETMEGAAFLYGCLSAKTPCAQIRAISNHVQERDKSRWQLSSAIENLNKTILKILQELCT